MTMSVTVNEYISCMITQGLVLMEAPLTRGMLSPIPGCYVVTPSWVLLEHRLSVTYNLHHVC